MQVKTKNDVSILSIKEFLGLNENPDGDTTLKDGEMAEMRNFKITQDKHLQIRAGSKTLLSLADAARAANVNFDADDPTARVYGVWRGAVGAREHNVVAYAGLLFDVDLETPDARVLGTVTKADTSFIGFNDKVYLLNGTDYKSWDGGDNTQFADVEPYIPVVQTATSPTGEGTQLEGLNRLTPKRRVLFSPDGSATTFVLPEDELTSIDSVKLNGTATTAYTADTAQGAVTMNSAPSAGVNTLEVTYSKGSDYSDEVKGMRFAELFNGATDTRIFLYGDGSNRTIYSGIPYDTGEPSGEYFPQLYEVAVGEKNTPITALVRHYSRMMAFKPNSTYVITYGSLDLSDASTTAAFYVQPVNRQFGNEAYGQVKLLENNPLTLDVGSVYQWKSSGYSTYITANENNAKRISDRVTRTLRQVKLSTIKTANIKHEHEYWFMLGGGKVLILNYANDVWYIYEGLTFTAPLEVDTETYGVGDDGRVVHFSSSYRNDDGEPIDAYAATGAMDFDRDWLLKYSPMLYVAMQPQSNARVYVAVESNRRSGYPKKLVAYGLSTFLHMDFNHFSFGTNRKPQVKRIKLKVKKATFYRLIFESNSTTANATIIETDIKLRYAGSVK